MCPSARCAICPRKMLANKRGTRLFQTTVEWVKKGPIRANRGIYEDHMEISGLCEVKNSSRVALNRQKKLLYMRIMRIPCAFFFICMANTRIFSTFHDMYLQSCPHPKSFITIFSFEPLFGSHPGRTCSPGLLGWADRRQNLLHPLLLLPSNVRSPVSSVHGSEEETPTSR